MQNQAMETAIEIFAKLVNQEEVAEQGSIPSSMMPGIRTGRFMSW